MSIIHLIGTILLFEKVLIKYKGLLLLDCNKFAHECINPQ